MSISAYSELSTQFCGMSDQERTEFSCELHQRAGDDVDAVLCGMNRYAVVGTSKRVRGDSLLRPVSVITRFLRIDNKGRKSLLVKPLELPLTQAISQGSQQIDKIFGFGQKLQRLNCYLLLVIASSIGMIGSEKNLLITDGSKKGYGYLHINKLKNLCRDYFQSISNIEKLLESHTNKYDELKKSFVHLYGLAMYVSFGDTSLIGDLRYSYKKLAQFTKQFHSQMANFVKFQMKIYVHFVQTLHDLGIDSSVDINRLNDIKLLGKNVFKRVTDSFLVIKNSMSRYCMPPQEELKTAGQVLSEMEAKVTK